MSWKESEIKAYEWFKQNIDPNAESMGREDSTVPDIYSPLLNLPLKIILFHNSFMMATLMQTFVLNLYSTIILIKMSLISSLLKTMN